MLDLQELAKAIGDLEEEKALSILRDFVAGNPTEEEAGKALAACQEGMGIVGRLYETGEYFIGDLIFSGRLLTEAVGELKPILGAKNDRTVGKMVLGTVHGDLHDIGKNIFKGMSEASGFEIYDLGIDVPAEKFVEKTREIQPDIVALSGVLTLAIDSMKDTVDALKNAGLRETVRVIIGGACASRDAMIVSGADSWSTNAAEAVGFCLGWVEKAG